MSENRIFEYNCTQKKSLLTYSQNQNYNNLKKNTFLSIEEKIAIIYFLDHGSCTSSNSRKVQIYNNIITFFKSNTQVSLSQTFFYTLVQIFPFYTMNQLLFLSKLLINLNYSNSSNFNSIFAELTPKRNNLINTSSKIIGAQVASIYYNSENYLTNFSNIVQKKTSDNNKFTASEKRRLIIFKYIYNKIYNQLSLLNQINDENRWKIFVIALLYSNPSDSLRVPSVYIRFVPGAIVHGGLPHISVLSYYPMLDDFFGNDYDSFSIIKTKPGIINSINIQKINLILSELASRSIGLYSEEMIQLIKHKFGKNFTSNVYFSLKNLNHIRRNHSIVLNKNSSFNKINPLFIPFFQFYLTHSKSEEIFKKAKQSLSAATNSIRSFFTFSKKTNKVITTNLINSRNSINSSRNSINSTLNQSSNRLSSRRITIHFDLDNKPSSVTFQNKENNSVTFPYETIEQITSYGIKHLSHKQLQMIYDILYQTDMEPNMQPLFYDKTLVQLALLYVILFQHNSSFKKILQKIRGSITVNFLNKIQGKKIPLSIQTPNTNNAIRISEKITSTVGKLFFNRIGLGRPQYLQTFESKDKRDIIFEQLLLLAHYISKKCTMNINIKCIFYAYEALFNDNIIVKTEYFNILQQYALYIKNILDTYKSIRNSNHLQNIRCINFNIHIPNNVLLLCNTN